MTEFININALLYAGKWLFVGLIYLFLFIVLIAVRREMRLRIGGRERLPSEAPGRLLVRSPGGDKKLKPGAAFNLNLETQIGAGADNDIVLTDPYVSAKHARIRWDGAKWWIEDLGSTNGSYLGAERLLPMKPSVIPNGAVLRLGDVTLELVE